MTVRNLDRLLKPSSIVIVGASQTPGSIAAVVTRNILSGGFSGPVYLVNPDGGPILGHPTVPGVDALPAAPDLAVIPTATDTLPELIAQLGNRGVKAAVIIRAKFSGIQDTLDPQVQARMLSAARPHLLRIAGPNALGIMIPGIGLNAGFAHVHTLPGKLAFVAQSAAVLTSVLDWATSRRIGFSHLISLGDMADVDFGDMLDYLANDAQTRAILLYIESVTQVRKFMSAARAAARVKPVIVVKAGRHRQGARSPASVAGAGPGSDAVYDAAFRRAGMLRVTDMQALFDSVQTLAVARPFSGDRLAIVTNGAAMGVMATDGLIDRNGRLAKLCPETMARLDALLPGAGSRQNPIDIIGDAAEKRYGDVLSVLLDDPGVDAILAIHCPSAVGSSSQAAQALIETVKQNPYKVQNKGILACWIGETTAEGARALLAENGIAPYRLPVDAVRAFMQMVRYRKSQDMLMEVPPDVPETFQPDTGTAKAIIAGVLAEGRTRLTEIEAKTLLAAYQLPVAQSRLAETPEAAEKIAGEIPGPVALKIVSPDITHKTDVGGVALDLDLPETVRAAAQAMLELVHRARPEARITGFSVQPMIRRTHARELMVGVANDALFGPVLQFGHGGIAAEVINDTALALLPLNMHLARDVMEQTRIVRLLEGFRGTPPADQAAIAFALVKVSQMICDLAQIVELEINPLMADENGTMALDARIRVGEAPDGRQLAICAYPKDLEQMIELADGTVIQLRPIRPEDGPAFHDLFHNLSAEDIRFRFLHPMKYLSPALAARLTQIDYDREMALVLAGSAPDGKPMLYGAVRIVADPDMDRAEFAIMLHRQMTGLGLGPMLMRRIIDYARSRQIKEIFGEILAENRPMLKICRAFGFLVTRDPEDPGVMIATLRL